MNAPLRKSWTQDEFLHWAEVQDIRHEFDGFQPVAMTGGNVGHSRISVNLLAALKARLRGGPCEPLGPDAGIETMGKAVRYPDALVTCATVESDARLVPGVIVIFEVISSSSSRIDRIVKVREYASVASVRRYVILESSSVGLTVLDRAGSDETWRHTVLTGGDILRMPEIGIEIPVAEIYDGIAFAEQGEVPPQD